MSEALQNTLEAIATNDASGPRARLFQATRREFELATGEFSEGDAWYEERIQYFIDWYVCDHVDSSGMTRAEQLRHSIMAAPDAARDLELKHYTALTRTLRGLFFVQAFEASTYHIVDVTRDARYSVLSQHVGLARLAVGDLFDGHIVSLDNAVHVLSGGVFHSEDTHLQIHLLVKQAFEHALEEERVLNALLRMNLRLQRFTRLRVQHVYAWESIWEPSLLG